MSLQDKLVQTATVLVGFALLVTLVMALLRRYRGGRLAGDRLPVLVFAGPALALVTLGLVASAVRTVVQSLQDARGEGFVGLDNYIVIFTRPDLLQVFFNTLLWVLLVPTFATFIGLVYAVAVDRSRGEALAKSLLFLPSAISLVGAGIIWKFVYAYRPDQQGVSQIGLANQFLVWLGMEPQQFLVHSPWNTFFIVVVQVWIQAGFAMVLLSAAIKGIPDDVIEAARLDGAGAGQIFRFITVPAIRPAIVVVLTTIMMQTMKVFDLVRTMTGGNFDTSVVANEFYTQTFRMQQYGIGAALAVVLFVLVTPVIAYNLRQLRKADAR